MGIENYITLFVILGSTHLFYKIANNISTNLHTNLNNMNQKLGIIVNENTKLKNEISNIKERLTDLEAFRLRAYEKNLSMVETRKWEEHLDIDFEEDDEEEETY